MRGGNYDAVACVSSLAGLSGDNLRRIPRLTLRRCKHLQNHDYRLRFKLEFLKLTLIQIYMLCAMSKARCSSSLSKMLRNPGQLLGMGGS